MIAIRPKERLFLATHADALEQLMGKEDERIPDANSLTGQI